MATAADNDEHVEPIGTMHTNCSTHRGIGTGTLTDCGPLLTVWTGVRTPASDDVVGTIASRGTYGYWIARGSRIARMACGGVRGIVARWSALALICRLIRGSLILLVLISPLANAEDFLRAADAFKSTAQVVDGRMVEVRFEIAKGYYLYRDKFRFAAEPSSLHLGVPVLPRGKAKTDENFGKVEVYYREVKIRLPVESNDAGVLPLVLNITSQGCADAGVCYPPQKQTISLELPEPATASLPVSPEAKSSDESGRIAQLLGTANLWLVVASFVGFGLLLSLTPCVFPMIPILSGIIVGSGSAGRGVSHMRGFALSLAYVLGMASTYTAAGVAAGLSGTLLSAALQNPWVLSAFALIFVALSLSMFGFYELQMPAFLQSKVSSGASRLKGGSLLGVVLMGALSGIIVGPCVAAPLAGALLYIGQTGDALLGGMALFSMALGMGTPLLAVGLSAGTLLPRSGPWMKTVKEVFGVILLATAVWIVSPVVPVAVQMTAWSLLLVVTAVFLRAVDALPHDAISIQRFGKGIGVVMLTAGVAMLLGVFSGARDPLLPLAGLYGASRATDTGSVQFERIHSIAELEARLKESTKPVMLDFYADWCVSCKEMERSTFAAPPVRQKLSDWLVLQADVTANSEDEKALLARFKLFGPPSTIFFDSKGQEVRNVRIVGFQNAEDFLKTLEAVIL